MSLQEAILSYRAALALDPQRQERAGRESREGIERIEKKLATPSVGAEYAPARPRIRWALFPAGGSHW